MKDWAFCCAWVALVAAACTDSDSATDLNPEGPPMIRQVRMRVADKLLPIFTFGSHPLADASEVVANPQNAKALDNDFRIIVDELLVGNNLQEILCRATVDDDPFARVPLGTTPDDIARCSVPNDALVSSCSKKDRHSVCLCQNPAGCARDIEIVPEGEPIGVQDLNMDGAADKMQAIRGSVGIQCGTISVPIDLGMTYWNPSGDQNKPAMGGFDVLGPAIVLVPSGALPTNISCNLSFSEEVVDKQNNRICAPANGDIAAGCEPGDVSAFGFKVEPLSIVPGTFADGATGVDKAGPYVFQSNAPLDAASIASVTISPNPPGAVTVTLPMATTVRIDAAGGFAPMTTYTITFPVAVKDGFQQPLPAARVITFTTGA